MFYFDCDWNLWIGAKPHENIRQVLLIVSVCQHDLITAFQRMQNRTVVWFEWFTKRRLPQAARLKWDAKTINPNNHLHPTISTIYCSEGSSCAPQILICRIYMEQFLFISFHLAPSWTSWRPGVADRCFVCEYALYLLLFTRTYITCLSSVKHRSEFAVMCYVLCPIARKRCSFFCTKIIRASRDSFSFSHGYSLNLFFD